MILGEYKNSFPKHCNNELRMEPEGHHHTLISKYIICKAFESIKPVLTLDNPLRGRFPSDFCSIIVNNNGSINVIS